MHPTLIVGSVAFDTLHIAGECHKKVLGGSATYASIAATHFGPVQLVGVVGRDFPDTATRLLRERGVKCVVTTTPRYDGRSFGTNLTEAMLTAYAGKGRPLDDQELNGLIDELDLRPTVQILNP